MGLDSGSLVAVASGLFILPFFLFSHIAGQMADKFEKSAMVRKVKLAEIFIMVFAGIGFFVESYYMLIFVLFFMGLQSTFFGPLKFSLIPELVSEEELTESNAFIELGTFLSILLGTILGGTISASPNVDIIAGSLLIGVAALGYFSSRGIPECPIAAPDLQIQYNPIPEYKSLWKILGEKVAIFNSVLAVSWFWFFGAGVLSVLPIYVREFLNADENVVTIFLAMFTVGIGIGSFLCEKMSYKRVEIGLVPIGSIGMTLFLIDLFLVGSPWSSLETGSLTANAFLNSPQSWRLLFDFMMMSIFGGLYIVPLYTLIQDRSDDETRSRVIAGNNIVNAIFMVASSILVVIFYMFKLDTAQIFLVFALLNMIISVYIYFVVPEFTLRLYSWILSRTMYSVKTTGIEKIPKQGSFVLVANHVSYVDWLILSGACKVPLRFVMYYKFFDIPVVKWFMKQAKVIPIASAKESVELMNKAFKTISAELEDDNAICIFPEGRITKDGKLCGFRPGISKILEKNPVPVLPVVIHDMYGSVFSRSSEKNRSMKRRKIRIEFLSLIPASEVTPEKLEDLFAQELGEVAPHKREEGLKPSS